jgi:hypothetical protein
MSKIIHTDDSCIPTVPAAQFFEASDDLLQKKIWSWNSPKQPLIISLGWLRLHSNEPSY